MHTTFDIHPDVQLFDSLPDSALVPSSVVTRVLGISRSGLWLGVKEGRIPAPVKLGDRTTRFQVGKIREFALTGYLGDSL